MSQNSYTINIHSTGIRSEKIASWFRKNGFSKVKFEAKQERITTYWLEQPVVFKLTKVDGFDTFYKEAYGGSLIVFETATDNSKLTYNCYCPIFLFGIWTKKLAFKKKAGKITKYREQGYQIHERFKQFVTGETSQ